MSQIGTGDADLLRQVRHVSLGLAMRALQGALDQARTLNVAVSIVIVDGSGQPIHLAQMDDAPFACQEIALRKARTAAGFRASTRGWEERLAGASPAVRQGLPLQEGLVLFGGGEPFIVEGQLLGAVGVSGASEAQDQACALAACRVVTDSLG